jgi:hypothetical protein
VHRDSRKDDHDIKVLFATDGSDSALQAQKLIASISWPAGTRLLALHVLPSLGLGMTTTADEERRRAVDHTLVATRKALAGDGRVVDSVAKVGRPASTDPSEVAVPALAAYSGRERVERSLTQIGDPTGASLISGDLYDELVRDARTYATAVAVEAAPRLKSGGRTAIAEVAEGSSADALAHLLDRPI